MYPLQRKARTIVNREEIAFPFTQHTFSIVTRKDSEGKVVSSESELSMLTTAITQIRDLCLPATHVDASRYDLLLPTISHMEIRTCEKVDGQWNFDQGVRRHVDETVYRQVKQVVFDCMSGLLAMFEQYYNTSTARSNTGVVRNEEMTRFLRICGRSKLRYLRDICDIYIALNAQTYMDIVGGLLLDNNFTVNSLVVITGHQLLLTDKIRGNHTLVGATRKQGSDTKGEIHTKRGLSISYNKSFLIHIPRVTRREDVFTYETIELQDDSLGPMPGPSSSASLSAQPPLNAIPEIQQHRFRTIEGDRLHSSWCADFNTLCRENDLNEIIARLDSSVATSFLELLTTLNTAVFQPLLFRIKQNTYQTRCNDMIIDKFAADDAFQAYDRVELLRSVLIPLIALVEVEVLPVSEHIRSKILTATDIWDIVATIVDTVKNVTG